MIPVYGYGIFNVSREGEIVQHIIFEYIDPAKRYIEIIRDRRRLAEELRTLRDNMQYYLDEEEVRINGRRVRPVVKHVDVGIAGTPERPYIEYLIVFEAPLIKGVNTYEDIYEPEISEYDYTVMWVFPRGTKVIDVQVGFDYVVVDNRIVVFKVKEGSETPGYEKIVFEID